MGDDNIGVITEDCYYRDQHDMAMEERVKVNYDHPNLIDHDLLFHHLQLLKAGKSIDLFQYDYTQHIRKRETIFSA
ncbi:Uridine kinase [Arsenophonus endosymbiont of Bemisia tabaci Q2]|nr:Uridine kinase [Arsenophonus endosymbiont of Bemisia tabaci Q2]